MPLGMYMITIFLAGLLAGDAPAPASDGSQGNDMAAPLAYRNCLRERFIVCPLDGGSMISKAFILTDMVWRDEVNGSFLPKADKPS